MDTLIALSESRDDIAAATSNDINVTLAYETLSAALWATETLTRLFRKVPNRLEPRLSPWNFSTLEDPALREQALAAATHSDLIVIATSSGSANLPASVENWLGKCLESRHGENTAVAALFGQANQPDRLDSPRILTVQRIAKEAGCEFFAPRVGETALSVA
jgi:hypothetical protein